MKANKVLHIKITGDKFFRAWMDFLTPFHKLTAREKDVAARIIAQYFKLKEGVDDPVLMKEVLWSQSSRKDMRESLHMTPAHFQMVLAKLRTAGFITDGDINPRYIPNMTDQPRFMMCVIYDWSSPSAPVTDVKQD